MTNFEDALKRDIETVKEILSRGIGVKNSDGRIANCYDIECDECKFYKFTGCAEHAMKWFDAERPEPIFECDELVEVSRDGENWRKRYYARYEDGNHYCYAFGANSKTINSVTEWEYIKKCEQ